MLSWEQSGGDVSQQVTCRGTELLKNESDLCGWVFEVAVIVVATEEGEKTKGEKRRRKKVKREK